MNVLIHNFNILAGVDRQMFSDLRLVTECGRSINVHKLVIAGVTKTLKVSQSVDELIVRNVKFSALENIIKFIYTGKIIMKPGPEVQDFVAGYKVLDIDLRKKINESVKRSVGDILDTSSESDNSEEEEFNCSSCDKSYSDKAKLERHIRDKHSVKVVKEKITYACELCGEKYTVYIIVKIIIYLLVCHSFI